MNIVVTGASRGIGFELAKQFAKIGNHNIFAISRNSERLNELKSACIRENVEAHLYPIPFDLTSDNHFEEVLLKKFTEFTPTIDILINNAGYLANSEFEKLSNNDLLQMTQVNFTAPAKLIKTLLPLMKKGSHVVNIGSMGGFQGSVKFPGLSVYSATKAALASLTECLAEEYKESGISFNCLTLGAVNTEMLSQAFPNMYAPLNADEMASFIVDFALNGNKFFNGKIIPVSTSTP
ncbi:MAG: SDR family NAD(P)-dependent oxidoreductase [Bacteroidales bacterium]